jgi:undecaprenyl-diphosphatase
MAGMLIARLDARDRALFMRWSMLDGASKARRMFWATLTHVGGARATVAVAALPVGFGGAIGDASRHATVTLIVSHLVVQLVKRTIGRPRPSKKLDCRALVAEPDQFSFPSGHSTAAMAVAVVYAMAFPPSAIVLIPLAILVGVSRVCLGVHYPGDVFIGQLIAVLSALPIVSR